MFQPTRNQSQPDSYYNEELLIKRLSDLSTTPRGLAIKAGLSTTTVGQVLAGECKKMATLWPIAKALGLKWEYLFMLDLPKDQFRRAVDEAVR